MSIDQGSPYRDPASVSPERMKEQVEQRMKELLYRLLNGETAQAELKAYHELIDQHWELSKVYVGTRHEYQGKAYDNCSIELKDPVTGAVFFESEAQETEPKHQSETDLLESHVNPGTNMSLILFASKHPHEKALEKRKGTDRKPIEDLLANLNAGHLKAQQMSENFKAFEKRIDLFRVVERCLHKIAHKNPAEEAAVRELVDEARDYRRRNWARFIQTWREIAKIPGVDCDDKETERVEKEFARL